MLNWDAFLAVLIPSSQPFSQAETKLLNSVVPLMAKENSAWCIERVTELEGAFGLSFESRLRAKVWDLLEASGFKCIDMPEPHEPCRPLDLDVQSAIFVPADRVANTLTGEQKRALFLWKCSVAKDEAFVIQQHSSINVDSVFWYCYKAMFRAAYRFTDSDLGATIMSYFSHSQAYLSTQRDSDLKLRWAKFFEKNRSSLLRLGERLAEPDATEIGGRLERILTKSWQAAAELAPLLERNVNFGEITKTSPFHKQLVSDEKWLGAIETSEWFWRYRAFTNLLYLHLRHLGINDVQRFLLCYLVAETGFKILGKGSEDIMRKVPGIESH